MTKPVQEISAKLTNVTPWGGRLNPPRGSVIYADGVVRRVSQISGEIETPRVDRFKK